MFKKVLKAVAIGAASVGSATLAEFAMDKAASGAPKAAKVAAKFAGAAVGAGIAVAIVK